MIVRRVDVLIGGAWSILIGERYRAAAARFSRADAVLCALALSGSNFSASDGDSAAVAVLSSAYTCCALATYRFYYSFLNEDISARKVSTAAYAC